MTLHPCILKGRAMVDLRKEMHVITKFATALTLPEGKKTMKRRIIVGPRYCSNEHQRDCDKEKLSSVIAMEYSWIATSFYDSAHKSKLDVNHVSSGPLCNGLQLFCSQNLDGKRQEVRFSFLTTPNRKLPETSKNTGNWTVWDLLLASKEKWHYQIFALYFIFQMA